MTTNSDISTFLIHCVLHQGQRQRRLARFNACDYDTAFAAAELRLLRRDREYSIEGVSLLKGGAQ